MREQLRGFSTFFGKYFVYFLIFFIGVAVFFNFYDKGKIRKAMGLEGSSSISSAGPPVVTKHVLKDAQENATFETGEEVKVELTVYEASSTRTDYKIEDTVPTSSNTISQVVFTAADGNVKTISDLPVQGGKIIIIGNKEGSNVELKKGKNTFTYSYKLN